MPRYTSKLVDGLAAEDLDLRYFFDGQLHASPPEVATRVPSGQFHSPVVRYSPVPVQMLLKTAKLRLDSHRFDRAVLPWSPDLMFFPDFFPLSTARPAVISVMDLSALLYPEWHPVARARWFARKLPAAVEQAVHILVISQNTRDELIKHMGVSPHRITVTYLAADERFSPDALDAQVLQSYGLQPGAYFLTVGTLEPRKNLLSLLRAYSEVPASLRERVPLVLSGLRGWQDNAEFERLGRQLGDSLRLPGFVDDNHLPALYAGARAYLYPTLYEGFGLPAAEAMASGAPVISSPRGSLLEVIGEAGILLEPEDIDAWTEVIIWAIESPEELAPYVELGIAQAGKFSWSRCASETAAVLRRLTVESG